MVFQPRYHSDVREVDLPKIDSKTKERIKKAIETRLATAPHHYGEPLRKTLKGYWKLRVGAGYPCGAWVGVVFKTVGNEVWIFCVIHRKGVYEKIGKRV